MWFIPPLSEIEHLFFNIATVIGASEIVFLALAALTLLLYKLARLIVEEHYELRSAIAERKSSVRQ
jgi:hypothetical protein